VPVLLAALGALVMSLDAAANIAFPAMAAAFGVGPSEIRWVIVCYVFAYAVTSFAAGVAADRLGPRPVFVTGLWLSALAFAAYPLAGAFPTVLAIRVLQGVGGGLVYGTAPAIVTLSTAPERHGRALGALAFGMGAGLSLGPIVGGVLVGWGWAWAFTFRAPLALGVGLAALLLLPRLRGTGRWRLPPRSEWLRRPVLQSLALAGMSSWAQFSVWLLAPFYIVSVLGLPAEVGGLVFVLGPVGTALGGPLGGWLNDRVGRRGPMVSGLLIEASGLAALSGSSATTPVVAVGAALFAVGLGIGVFQVPNLAQVMGAFPVARQGAAGGLAFLGRTLGVVVGVQVNASVFAALEQSWGFVGAFSAALGSSAAVCAVAAALAAVPARPAARRDPRAAGPDPGL
jgi:MFS family permease